MRPGHGRKIGQVTAACLSDSTPIRWVDFTGSSGTRRSRRRSLSGAAPRWSFAIRTRTNCSSGRSAMAPELIASILETRHLAPQHGDRGFREGERGRWPLQQSGYRRMIGIGMTVRSIVDPYILLAAKRYEGYRS